MARDRDDDDRERPKKSWREVDRMRDKSAHRKRDKEREPPPGRRRTGYSRYKSSLDRLFDGGAGSEKLKKLVREKIGDGDLGGAERQQALRAIRDAGTGKELRKAVAAFREQWEMPGDFEILTRVLELHEDDVLLDALQALDALLDHERPRRTSTMQLHLQRIADETDEDEIRELAEKILGRL
jgi:hypothetical protein